MQKLYKTFKINLDDMPPIILTGETIMENDEETKLLQSKNGIAFISFCLERIKKGQSVHLIWHDWQEKAGQFSLLI